MKELRDIKPLAVIPDDSFVYFLLVLFVVLAVLLTWGYYLWRGYQLRHRHDKKRIALDVLKNLDFNDSKATAYSFSHYADALVNEDNLKKFEKINAALQAYKYKKQVGQLDQDLITQIKKFIYV